MGITPDWLIFSSSETMITSSIELQVGVILVGSLITWTQLQIYRKCFKAWYKGDCGFEKSEFKSPSKNILNLKHDLFVYTHFQEYHRIFLLSAVYNKCISK